MERVSILLFTSLLVITATCHQNTFSEQKRLYEHLKVNLDNKIRPVINQSNFVNINIEVNLQAIQGLDEKEQLLHSTISLTCRWKYETLVWNESEFSGIKSLYVSPEDAWIPDLIASNTIDSLFVLTENRADMLQIRVESNGDATWYTGGNIRTSCNIDITKYPFDVQKCTITISKTTADSEVLIVASSEQVVRVLYRDNSEWDLRNSVVETRVIYGYITFLDINLTLKRHSLFYVLNIIIPVILLSFMTVMSFKIPAASGERLGYSIALLLTFVVMLNLISDSMPRVPKYVSYLQLYIIYQLTVAVVITSLSILLVSTTHNNDQAKIPGLIKFYYRCFIIKMKRKRIRDNARKAVVSVVNKNEDKTVDSQCDTSNIQPTSDTKCDSAQWIQFVVQHTDESLFIVFMVLFFISTVLLLALIAT